MIRGRALGPGRVSKRGRLWLLDYRDENGVRRRVALAENKRDAERMRSEIIHKRDMAIAGLASEEGQHLLLSEVYELYIEDLRTRVTPAHFGNVETKLQEVIDELGPKRVRDLRAMDLVRVRTRATSAGASNRTANLRIDRVRAMLKWAAEMGVVALNPVANVRRLPEGRDHQKYKRRAMTDGEIERFLAASEADDEQNAILWDYPRVPQTTMWRAFLETGARWNELRQAVWGDVDFEQRAILLRAENSKSKKRRVIPLRDELVARLKELRVLHENVHYRLPNASDRIFLSPEGKPWPKPTTNPMRIFDRLLKAARIPKLNAMGEKLDIHALRHTCNSWMARRGVPLDKRQRILGHSDPKLTASTYTHLDVEDLRPAIEALGSPSEQVKKAGKKSGESA